MFNGTEVTMGEYDQCPRCDRYRVAEFLEVFTSRNNEERPDGWRRFLPWNWYGPMETNAFRIEQCKNCGHRVHVVEMET